MELSEKIPSLLPSLSKLKKVKASKGKPCNIAVCERKINEKILGLLPSLSYQQ
jgi:hypothetical protein